MVIGLPKHSKFFVDPACKSLSEELRVLGIVTTKADNNSKDKVTSNGTKIEIGIERMQSAFSKGRFFFTIMMASMVTIISSKN